MRLAILRLQMHAISGIRSARPLRRRQSLARRTCLLRRILRSPRAPRLAPCPQIREFICVTNIDFVPRSRGESLDGARATAPTIPLIARTSRHGVLTRKPIYRCRCAPVRPATTDTISDNARIAGRYRDLTRSPPDIPLPPSFRKGVDVTREGFRIATVILRLVTRTVMTRPESDALFLIDARTPDKRRR